MTTTHRRISFEWALMDGVNDRDSDVEELAEFALGLGAHVNVIPLNETIAGAHEAFVGSPATKVRSFCDALLAPVGVNATVRRTRGSDIAAACGQLAGATASEVALRTLGDEALRRAARGRCGPTLR